MADEYVNTQVFNVRDLGTQSVTIFPKNAQVVRVLEDVALKPGTNHIEVLGLSPTVDEGSIKVDGHGKATISGVTVKLIRNPEHYQDIYDSESDDEHDKPDPERLPLKPEALRTLEARVRNKRRTITLLDEEINSAQTGTKALQELTMSVSSKSALSRNEIASRLELYQITVQQNAHRIQNAEDNKAPLQEELPKLTLELEAAQRAYMRDTRELRKSMKRAEDKWRRERQARQKARKERFEERAKFWPKEVFKVVIAVEQGEDAAGAEKSEMPDKRVSLSIQYVTSEASWTPAYDLTIESESNTATLIYRAEISNATSETWRDTKVTLSTSQTSFRGLRDPIPELLPWHMRLQSGHAGMSNALNSAQERVIRWPGSHIGFNSAWRREKFGVLEDQNPARLQSLFGNVVRPQAAPVPPPPPPAAPIARASFGAPVASALGAPGAGALFGGSRGGMSQSLPHGGGGLEAKKYESESDDDLSTAASSAAMSVSEASWEESGLTATWDLSGSRTIAPSSNKPRYRIATIALADLRLRHVCVPKLRTDAFLTTQLRNPSDQTILAGDAGLTLDGAFLGTTTLKRVAPGESTTVSLGVDESIVVEYTKPTEKRNQKRGVTSGLLTKEASSGFQRCVTLRHTKSAAKEGGKEPPGVEITVYDQVPVPMDERIKLDLQKPGGLRAVGEKVRAGEEVREGTTAAAANRGSISSASGTSSAALARAASVRKDAWGSATAEMNKHGEIEWRVKLNAGQKVALPLEYEVRYPASENLHGD